jgi:AcrR family transcriptional regulator
MATRAQPARPPSGRPSLGRRRATQARSKATVERILDSASALIVEKGPDAVTMTEIARRAQVVIGSLYQYFADRSAINRALLLRHHEEVRDMLKGYLSGVESFTDFLASIEAAAARYYDLHQSDPVYNGIWSAVQTDAELQRLDLADTLLNARQLHAISRPLLPAVDSDELMATCALLIQFALTTGRFARVMPPALKRQMLPIFRRILRLSMDALYAENAYSGSRKSRPAGARK